MGSLRDTKIFIQETDFGTEETSNSSTKPYFRNPKARDFQSLEFISGGGKRSQTRCLAAPQRGMMLVVPPHAELEGNDHENRARLDEKVVKDIMKTAQMHLVVATLLMTMTFTAGFTLPGGFESDTNNPNKGMAILLRRTAFRAFAVSDAIAFACSSGAVFAYFAMTANAISAVTKLTVIIQIYNMAIALQIFAMAAVVVAFATGMYVTLEHSLGLAVTGCFIGCISFIVFCLSMILLPQNRPT